MLDDVVFIINGEISQEMCASGSSATFDCNFYINIRCRDFVDKADAWSKSKQREYLSRCMAQDCEQSLESAGDGSYDGCRYMDDEKAGIAFEWNLMRYVMSKVATLLALGVTSSGKKKKKKKKRRFCPLTREREKHFFRSFAFSFFVANAKVPVLWCARAVA